MCSAGLNIVCGNPLTSEQRPELYRLTFEHRSAGVESLLLFFGCEDHFSRLPGCDGWRRSGFSAIVSGLVMAVCSHLGPCDAFRWRHVVDFEFPRHPAFAATVRERMPCCSCAHARLLFSRLQNSPRKQTLPLVVLSCQPPSRLTRLAQEREQLRGRPERGCAPGRSEVPRICRAARMVETVAERRQGCAGALSAPEVDRRDPLARLGMSDRETA